MQVYSLQRSKSSHLQSWKSLKQQGGVREESFNKRELYLWFLLYKSTWLHHTAREIQQDWYGHLSSEKPGWTCWLEVHDDSDTLI